MSRRRAAVHRPVMKDPKYQDSLVSKFICSLMKDGKKGVAESILYGAMDLIGEREKETLPLEVFRTAVEKVKPAMEVKSRRVGGSTYQVPMQVRSVRSQTLAIRWIVQNANARSGKSMRAKLADELLDAFNGRGNSIKKKEDTHKMADANKAFAHYRW